MAKQILSAGGNTPTSKEINQLANDNEFYSSLQKGNYGKMIASEKTLDYLKSKGIVSEDTSSNVAAALAIPASGAALIGGEMAMEKAASAGSRNRVATKSFSYDTGKVGKDNKPIMQPVEEGKPFNMSSIPENQRDVAKAASRVPDTKVTKAVKGTWNGLTKAGNSLRNFLATEQPIDEPTNPSNKQNGQQNTSSTEKNRHNDSSNKDSTSVPNKGEKSKFVSDGFGGMKPNPNFVEPSRFEKFASIAKKAFSHIHSPKGSFTAMAVTAAAGYEMLSGTDAQAAEFPTQNVNPSAALSGAKKDMSLRKPPAQKSGTVLDNALEDASADTGYAVLGLGILGLASKTAARVAPVAGEVFSVFVQIRGSQKESITKI